MLRVTDFPCFPGVYGFTATEFNDDRGVVSVPFQLAKLLESTTNTDFPWGDNLQVTVSHSRENTFRGVHFSPYPKLVMCLHGIIGDTLVDTKEDEDGKQYIKTNDFFLSNHVSTLQAKMAQELADVRGSFNALFVPPGVGHSFLALTDALVAYLSWGTWSEDAEVSVNAESWQFNFDEEMLKNEVIRSDRDLKSPMFKDISKEDWNRIRKMRESYAF